MLRTSEWLERALRSCSALLRGQLEVAVLLAQTWTGILSYEWQPMTSSCQNLQAKYGACYRNARVTFRDTSFPTMNSIVEAAID